jgi:methyl-accepting chemotaxis protein
MRRKALRKGIATCFGIMFLISSAAYSATPEPQSKQAKEVKALVDKGAALVESKGKEAFPEFRKKGSAWFKGDTYLFVDDLKGNVLVNPPDPKLEGENLMKMKDANGKLIIQAFINLLKTQESGWVDYMWPKPGSDKPSKKLSYIKKAKIPNGETVFVGAGIYAE